MSKTLGSAVFRPLTFAPQTLGGLGVASALGDASFTLGTITVTSTGTLAIVGAGAITLGELTVTAAGHGTGTGTAGITLDPIVTTSTGTLAISAAGAFTLGPITVSATSGIVPSPGVANITLGPITTQGGPAPPALAWGTDRLTWGSSVLYWGTQTSSTGLLRITGAGAFTLSPIAVTGTSTFSVTGSASITLGAITVAGTGTAPSINTRILSITDGGNGHALVTLSMGPPPTDGVDEVTISGWDGYDGLYTPDDMWASLGETTFLLLDAYTVDIYLVDPYPVDVELDSYWLVDIELDSRA